MAYKPSERRKITKRVTVEHEGDACWVDYYPARVTGKLFADMNALDTASERNAKWCERVVAAWDVVGDDDKPAPITYDEIIDYEPAFLAAVVTAIVTDMRPNPTNGDGS